MTEASGDEHRGPRLLVLGRQGAGKGTQCALLAAALDIAHISTGEVFRAAVAAGTPLGQRVKAFVDSGELVPGDLVNEVVTERLQEPGAASGFVLDGFPRTVEQADALFATLGPDIVDAAIEIDVTTEEALHRLARRRVCDGCGRIDAARHPDTGPRPCGRCPGQIVRRADDTEPAIQRRLALTEREGRPLLIWLHSRGVLTTVDGRGTTAAVHERIMGAVRNALPQIASAAS